MMKCICLVSYLILPLLGEVASSTPVPPFPPTYSITPQHPVSFSSPSQYPIVKPYTPSTDENYAFRGTINVHAGGPDHPISVKYILSSQVCAPLISKARYAMSDLSQQLLSEHLEGIAFPASSDAEMFPLPVYLAANITEQLYRSKYVLSLSLKLSPLENDSKDISKSQWKSIIALLEESADELDRAARGRNSAGLGSLLVLEAEIAGVDILAEWRFWSVIDGLTVMCEI